MTTGYATLPGAEAHRRQMSELREFMSLPLPTKAKLYYKIRTKTQGIQPFLFNEGQLKLHEHSEAQIEARGYVRTILLKARQWGGSTYIQGRGYDKVTYGPKGTKALIMTHKLDATGNLFAMTKRFHDHMDPRFRVFSPRSSATRLAFPRRDSMYTVATAGSKAAGRSDTLQFLHGSEFAYWANTADHLKGVFQTVPDGGPGTEIYIESTGDGMGNDFYRMCQEARKIESDYWFLFVPWFWFTEYAKPVPREMILTPDDELYQRVHGLSDEQMAFRWFKIREFGGGEAGEYSFKREYPTTPEDAFATSGEGSYIEAVWVVRARKAKVNNPIGPKIMGIDPAHMGKDRFSVCMRQGRKSYHVGEWRKKRTTESLGKCVALIRQHRPEYVFVDQGGPGAGIVDPLMEVAHHLGCRVIPIDFGGSADEPDRYNNKREEMYGRGKNWLMSDMPVQIDDSDALQADLTNPRYRYDTSGNIQPESKQIMCGPPRNLPSPDLAESFLLTFAYWVESTLPAGQGMPSTGGQIDPDRPIDWKAV